MKRCPQCNREYSDDTLRFCLEDGTPLADPRTRAEPPPTEILPARQRPTERSSDRTLAAYPVAPSEPGPAHGARRSHPILIAGVVAMVLLLMVLVAIAALYVIHHSPSNSNHPNDVSTTPHRPTPQ